MPDDARPNPLSLGKGSFALLCGKADATRAIVFVHGWGGSPTTTWHRIQELVYASEAPITREWWDKSDLFFYRYESRRFSIGEHTAGFSRFLDEVYPDPRQLLPPGESPSYLTNAYQELYVVGHSMGAVVIRRAILDRAAKNAGRGTTNRSRSTHLGARLRLFAPAMLGFKPTGWLGFCLQSLKEVPGVGVLFDAALESQGIVSQLGPDSREILELERLTTQLALETGFDALTAHIAFGEDERVVWRGKYLYDEITEPIPARDHKGVCKPNVDYLFPFEFIQRGVDYGARRQSAR